MRNFSIYGTKWKRPGAELDAIGARCTAGLPVLVVGRDDEIRDFRREFSGKVEIVNDCPVSAAAVSAGQFAPGAIQVVCVSVARHDYEAHRAYWNAKGFSENIYFFQSDVFRPVFHLYKYGALHLDRVEIFMTSHCTLNCEKCIAYIPYFKSKAHMPLDVLVADLDILFGKVDFVHKLKLLGGEGLMYPYLVAYLEYLFSRYSSRVGTVRIGTNATLLPDLQLLDVCRRYGVIMDVSDYAGAVPGKCRMDELLALLEAQGVKYVIKRTGEQWLDTGYPDNPATFATEADVVDHFHKCAMFCRDFFEGKLYFCCSNFAAVQAGIYQEHDNDYLDFNGDVSKKVILEYEIGFSRVGHPTFCSVCRGCSMEVNPHGVPVARQMEIKRACIGE